MEPKKERFLRMKEVLTVYPVSKSTWWAGIKTGRYPKPYKLGAKTVAWRESDISKLVEQTLGGGAE
ncbi:MAG: helix-turn-helix transcriptional regulator [Humidesulfovibrio sp.]|nr:AlpA family phage regulatory protein [Pseudomonadota bacterium]